jgi:putative AdoMet-dependent methyltransferase
VRSDLLAYCAAEASQFDAVISTYAVHHLTDDEKANFFALVEARLCPGGKAVFGDLMFADDAAREALRAKYAALGDTEVVEAIDEEFFWLVDRAVADMAAARLVVEEFGRFSELSWGICVSKPMDRSKS